MKALHVLAGGGIGGIENLMKDYSNISEHDNYFLFLWNGGDIYEEMLKSGKHVEVWNISKIDYFFVPFRILLKTKKENFEVIVTHHPAPLIHLSNLFVIHYNKNIKSLTYLHSSAEDAFRLHQKKYIFIKNILKSSYNSSKKIIAISNYVKDSLIKVTGISSNKISVVYNGIDTSKFHYHKASTEKLRMIYVGRLIKEKGVENILNFVATIPNTVNFDLLIVGAGPDEERLKKLSLELGLNEKIEFLGERRDVSDLLYKSDIFIHLPNWQEGFGITVIEAMAAGLICIVNDHGALPEIINDNKNGFIVKNNDINRFNEIIMTLWKKRFEVNDEGTELFAIKENAIERAKFFSIQNFAHNLDNIIDS